MLKGIYDIVFLQNGNAFIRELLKELKKLNKNYIKII